MGTYDFENALKRFFEITGCRTQLELAEFLQVRQSSISDAKRRKNIPAEWLVKLFYKKQVSPLWILNGTGAKYFRPADSETDMPHLIKIVEVRPPAECSSQELISELVRRALYSINTQEFQK